LEIRLGKTKKRGEAEETFLCSLKCTDFEEIHQKRKTMHENSKQNILKPSIKQGTNKSRFGNPKNKKEGCEKC